MSDDKKYGSTDELLAAVTEFVNSPDHKPGHFVGFKVHVFLGRGVHTFELDNKESEALKEVALLKKRLEQAEKKLEDARESNRLKRARTSENVRSYDTGLPNIDS